MGGKANGRSNKKDPRLKTHNHFPQGKTGYIPSGSGQTDLALLKR